MKHKASHKPIHRGLVRVCVCTCECACVCGGVQNADKGMAQYRKGVKTARIFAPSGLDHVQALFQSLLLHQMGRRELRVLFETWPKLISQALVANSICRVGQNHIYTVCIRYFWQGNHEIYGHIRCIYTVLANPKHLLMEGRKGGAIGPAVGRGEQISKNVHTKDVLRTFQFIEAGILLFRDIVCSTEEGYSYHFLSAPTCQPKNTRLVCSLLN